MFISVYYLILSELFPCEGEVPRRGEGVGQTPQSDPSVSFAASSPSQGSSADSVIGVKKTVKGLLHHCKKGFYDGFRRLQSCKMPKKPVESLLQPCKMVFTTVSGVCKAAKWQKRPKKAFCSLAKWFFDRFRRLQGCKRQKKTVDSILQGCKRAFTTVSSVCKAAKGKKRP